MDDDLNRVGENGIDLVDAALAVRADDGDTLVLAEAGHVADRQDAGGLADGLDPIRFEIVEDAGHAAGGVGGSPAPHRAGSDCNSPGTGVSGVGVVQPQGVVMIMPPI
jgi:hypothetical protein